ncbi:hypothetical protein EJ02DRAFT_152247 [Clathrospora elynae]|uniref:Secreted protein n=1 Tax=Clathrospora elynae TaxID=706981 RepID=A0A6A5SSE7_9PLEO|nr:hypothetical protein EJ02DRAFT_152247 [Clathrospora elynae]
MLLCWLYYLSFLSRVPSRAAFATGTEGGCCNSYAGAFDHVSDRSRIPAPGVLSNLSVSPTANSKRSDGRLMFGPGLVLKRTLIPSRHATPATSPFCLPRFRVSSPTLASSVATMVILSTRDIGRYTPPWCHGQHRFCSSSDGIRTERSRA